MIKSKSGFTIVELLIVIVVIGILAAISIVAYNGVQNRANDVVIQNDLSQMAKQMQAYTAVEGQLATPSVVSAFSAVGIKPPSLPTARRALKHQVLNTTSCFVVTLPQARASS